MKCPHLNCCITECAEEHKTHVIEDGRYVFSETQTGDLFATVHIQCLDCGLDVSYSRYHLPRYLRSYFHQIKGIKEQPGEEPQGNRD